MWLDGYFVQLAVCSVVGLGWVLVFKPVILRLQGLNAQAWCLVRGGGGGGRRGVTGSGEEGGGGVEGGGGEKEEDDGG